MTAIGTADGVDLAEERSRVASLRAAMGSNVGLWLWPVALLILAGALALYITSIEKDLSEASALEWAKLRPLFWQHLSLTFWSTMLVLVIAIPLGITLTRPSMRKFAGPILAFANSGQSIPAYGLLVLFAGWLGIGLRTAILALVVFAILPVLRNTMVGLDQVDRATIEAGRGMGMSKAQALFRIELPLAVPVILAGVRTALILNVGFAALAFLVGGGGLGVTINTGLKLQRNLVTFSGAAIVALVALTVDWLASVAEKFLRPRGI